MRRTSWIAGGVAVAGLGILALFAGYRALSERAAAEASTPVAVGELHPASETGQGFQYGRITTVDGDTYEGRLRWGGDQEAFWDDAFNGSKDENPWAVHVSPEQLKETRPLELFGVKIADREREMDLERPFMVRFGDVVRIEARGADLRVTLKSRTVFELNRYGSDDLADGLRVWDAERGVVDLHENRIRTVELLPTPRLESAPYRLHGTVRTSRGEFTGFLVWDRKGGLGSDELVGRGEEGKLSVRFDAIRSIRRMSSDSSRINLLDGRELLLAGSHQVGEGNRGVQVDDPRYGRVLIPWEAFERVDFEPAGSGPAYDDFPPGRPLAGRVTTRAGGQHSGRLVFDLDESETVETLDAPFEGVNYSIPFGRIVSIVTGVRGGSGAPHFRVTLHDGEEIELEPQGDLGKQNAGLLIFVDGSPEPEYVPWVDVERVDFDRADSTRADPRRAPDSRS